MSTAWPWIILPLFTAIILWSFRHYHRLTLGISVGLCITLALGAAVLPLGGTLRLGNWSLDLNDTLTLLGRQLRLTSSDRPLLILIYSASAWWFLGTLRHRTSPFFIPHGLATVALLVSAFAVEPFIYTAPLLVLGVFVAIPALSPPRYSPSPAILRFMALQSLALPLILIGGWVLSQYESAPQQIESVLPAVLLVAIGFALWLTIFPFHTWAVMLPKDNPLYEAGFFLVLITTAGFLVFLDFLNSNPWVRNLFVINATLQLVGGIMILYAGLGVWFTTNLNRFLGYSLILDSGFALIAIALGSAQGITYFLELLPGRVLGGFLLTHSLGSFQNHPEASSPHSPERLKPITWGSLGFLIGYFSLGGLPLLASFPVRQGILFSLAQQSLPAVMGVLLGNILFLLNGIRLIGYAVQPLSETIQFTHGLREISFLTLISIIGLLGLGLLPAFLLNPALQAAQSFINLIR